MSINIQRGAGAAAGSGLTLLSTASASNDATVDLDSSIDSTYEMYFLTWNDLVAASNDDLQIRVESGGAWKSGASDYAYTTIESYDGNATRYTAQDDAHTSMIITRDTFGNESGGGHSSGHLYFQNPAGTARFKAFWGRLMHTGGGHALRNVHFSGMYAGDTAAITGVQFLMVSGNITTGEFRLYGLQKS